MAYIVIITFLLAIYAVIAWNIGYIKNTRVVNLVFFLVIHVLYLVYVLQILLIVGTKSIYFHGVLATANVSPFMFSALPLIYFSRGRLREWLCLLISLLSVGMVLSPVMNAITYAVCGYPFEPYVVLDYISHLALSLWGIYLVKSNQVTLKKKDCIISGSIILGVAFLMLVLNLIFDTSFFGLSLTGKHNIYGNVIVGNSYISALIYFAGLGAVLFAGYAYSLLLSKKISRK